MYSIQAADISEMHQWGIDFIKAVQTIEDPVLSVIINMITSLGAGSLYLLILFYIIWCVDDKRGIQLSVLIILSTWVNGFLKILCKQPRPYDFDPSVGRALEDSYGFPSGHAQSVLVFFLGIASWLKKPHAYVSGIIIILVMSFTRLYLGVHFPTDILGGWLAGFIILALYWLLSERIIKVLALSSIRFRLIVSAAVSFIMLLLNPSDIEMPGVFFGMGMGYSVMIRYFPFDVKKKKQGKNADPFTLCLRYILGLICTGIVLFLGMKLINVTGESSGAYRIIVFVVYTFVGAVVTAGVPWLFIQTGLSARKEKNG